MPKLTKVVGAAVAIWSTTVPLAAQDTAQSPTPQPACDGRVVSGIDVVREEPRLIGKSAPGFTRPVLRIILGSALTKESAILPFLQVKPGGECSEFRLAESARVLRAQPYLAGATVTSTPDASGGVRVRVATVDEIPLVIGAGLRDGHLSQLEYGNANVRGEGAFAAASWREGFAYRDGLGLRLQKYHLLGKPIRVAADLQRAPTGSDVSLEATRPFYTQFQHTGWYVGARDASGYTGFLRPDAARLSLPTDRTRADAGAVFRFGGRSALLFAGPFLSHQRFRTTGDAVVVRDTGLAADPDTVLDGRYASSKSTRLAGVLGARWLSFLQVHGFDALTGPQDVARGVQATLGLGRALDGDRGTVAAGNLFAGVGGARNYVGLSMLTEGQQRGGRWADGVVSGRLAWYAKPTARQTRILGAEYSGASRQDEPFQLALGSERGGLRGYGDSRAVGARRLVARAEQRWLIPGDSRLLALGAAAFGDVGKVWAGDVPFGQTTGVRASVGVGLLASVPRQSRRLLRVDLAVPLVHDANAKYEVIVSTGRPPRRFWREPGDIGRLHAVLPPVGVFGWP
jgi:Omp85 superfamily domain